MQTPPNLCLNELSTSSDRIHYTWDGQIDERMEGTKLFDIIQRSVSAPSALERCEHRITDGLDQEAAQRRQEICAVTWNIAAPNNNPFEYWAMHSNSDYNQLMSSVQQCIDNPEPHDTQIGNIFTTSMYMELRGILDGLGVMGLDQLDSFWASDLKDRMAIREFLKDRSFGEKRLISMPDRMTGAVKTCNGTTAFRPSPITGIQNEMSNVEMWWSLWTQYMFQTKINVRGETKSNVFSLLEVIPRAKYPALSEAEEAVSVPLQTLCLALFDAIFIYVLSSLAPTTWQELKNSLHKSLYESKAALCVTILQEQYGDADVIFIQEASEAFAARAGVCLDHFVLRPAGVDGRRSQLSLILARKSRFFRHTARDLTEEVLRRLPSRCTTAGDLCVFEVDSHEGPCLLASFHGDSEGACTAPVLTALHDLVGEHFLEHTLLFGLDANTAAGPGCGESDRCGDSALRKVATCSAKPAGAATGLDGGSFRSILSERGLGSCWQGQDLRGLWTTFNARTYLQPQLHKAVGLEGVLDRRHMRLRDWLVFRAGQLAVTSVERDNTGRRGRFESRVMPSQGFPSDHAIVAAKLRRADGGVGTGRTAIRRSSTTVLP